METWSLVILALSLVMKKNKKTNVVKKYWWIVIPGIFLVIMIAGKIYGGMREDRFCQTSHQPTTAPPKELITSEDWLKLGDFDYERGECQMAIQNLDMAIKIDPEYAEAFNNRGFIKKKLGQYSESLLDFDRAIELRPDYPHALMNRGDAYKYLGDRERAIADYERVMTMGKEYVQSEAVCGRRDMVRFDGNILKVTWSGLLKRDDCWKMYFEK